MKVLYVTDDNGLDQLLTSLISLNATNPDIDALVYFTENGADLSQFAKYTEIQRSHELSMLYLSMPEKNNSDGTWLASRVPKTTYMKIPVVRQIDDDVLYVDIDTLFTRPVSSLCDFAGKMGVSETKSSGENHCDFNAGVMFFKKGYWNDILYYRYLKAVNECAGRNGDQEILSDMKLSFDLLPEGYNDRVVTPRTKILHFAGPKPWLKLQKNRNGADNFYMEKFKVAQALLKYVKKR